LLLLVLLLWWRHRRKRRKARAAAALEASAGDELAAADEFGGEATEPVEGGALEADGEVFVEPTVGGADVEPQRTVTAGGDHLDVENVGEVERADAAVSTAVDAEPPAVESGHASVDAEDEDGLQTRED